VIGVQSVLPVALTAYFLAKGRRQRLFLLGIPFLLFMGSALFFDRIKVPRLDNNQLILVCLVAVWIICTGSILRNAVHPQGVGPFGPRRLLREEIPLIMLAGLVIFNTMLSIYRYGDSRLVLQEASSFGYLIAGYFLVRGIIAHFDRTSVSEFLGSLVGLNTIAAVLYILHQGLHVQIYEGGELMEISYFGQLITRTFWFMPPLLLFSLAYCLSKPRLNLHLLSTMLITLLAILISYTRFLAVTTATLIVLAVFLRVVKRQKRTTAKWVIVLVIVGLVFTWGVKQFLPIQAQFMTERFNILMRDPTSMDANSWLGRRMLFLATWEMIGQSNIVLGVGFPPTAQDSRVFLITHWRADMLWIPIVFHLGLAGLVLIATLLFLHWIRALRLFLSESGERAVLGLTFFLLLSSVAVEGLFSSSFMYWLRYPLGLWYLAFLAVGAARGPGLEADVATKSWFDAQPSLVQGS